jgi:hypothetical protein
LLEPGCHSFGKVLRGRTVLRTTNRIASAGARHDLPVNVLALIDRHPDTRFTVDHLGILQPRGPPAPPQPWADLPKVLELAKDRTR